VEASSRHVFYERSGHQKVVCGDASWHGRTHKHGADLLARRASALGAARQESDSGRGDSRATPTVGARALTDDSVPGIGELPSIRLRRCAPRSRLVGEGRHVPVVRSGSRPTTVSPVSANFLRSVFGASRPEQAVWRGRGSSVPGLRLEPTVVSALPASSLRSALGAAWSGIPALGREGGWAGRNGSRRRPEAVGRR
jgi:hypothetical protein